MSRIRTIKPEFPQAESMGRVSRDARLLFVLLWTSADDEGRTRAAPRLLASMLYPYDDDAPSLIGAWLDELEAEGCIRRYEQDGERFLVVTKWREHQYIARPTPSRLPAPPCNGTRPTDSACNDMQPHADACNRKPRARAQDLGPRTMDKDHGTNNNTTHASGARWDVLTDAMVADGLAVRSENGKTKAQAGVVAGLLGPVADNDPDGAVELWRRFVSVCRADGSWQYVTGRNVGERVGKWLAGRSGAKRAWTLTGGGK